MSELIKYRKNENIGIITLNGKTNILGPKTNPLLRETLKNANDDKDIKSVIIFGNGEKSFIAGADLKTMQNLDTPKAIEFITDLHETIHTIRKLSKPVIAAVDGHCFGGGLELAISCDFFICSKESQFGMQEVVLGMPSVIEAALFPFICGLAKTREWLMLGEVFGADEALKYNLVNYVYEKKELEKEAINWAKKFAALPAHALKLQKELIFNWMENAGIQQSIKNGIDSFGVSYGYGYTQKRLKEKFNKK